MKRTPPLPDTYAPKPNGIDKATEERLVKEQPDAPRFMIVRHPHSRLLSGYLDKVVKAPAPQKWPHGFDSAHDGFAAFANVYKRFHRLV